MDEAKPALRIVSVDGCRRSASVWKCPVCQAEGHASGPVVEIALEATIEAGRIIPGERALVCLACHSRGKLTIVA